MRARPALVLVVLLGAVTLLVWLVRDGAGDDGREDAGTAPTTTVIPAVVAFAPVDEAMAARARAAVPAGGALLVVADGRVAFEKVYPGFALDRQVPLGALGDLLTALVAARLVDEGLLAFDEVPPGTDRTLATLLADGSGAGSATVRAATEEVTGQPWEEVFRSRLGDPLGLADTGFTPVEGVADGEDPARIFPGRTTLRDLGLVADLILNEGVTRGTTRVISAEGVRAVTEPAPQVSWATDAGAVVWLDRTRDAFAVVVVDDEVEAAAATDAWAAVTDRLPEAIDTVRELAPPG